MDSSEHKEHPRFMTIRDFCLHNSSFSENSIRWYIQHNEKYRFNDVYTRVGRRIFIKPDKFFEWMESK